MTYRNWGGRRISARVGQPPWRGKPECSCFLPLEHPQIKTLPPFHLFTARSEHTPTGTYTPDATPFEKIQKYSGFEILFALAFIIFIDGNTVFFFLFSCWAVTIEFIVSFTEKYGANTEIYVPTWIMLSDYRVSLHRICYFLIMQHAKRTQNLITSVCLYQGFRKHNFGVSSFWSQHKEHGSVWQRVVVLVAQK